ncbi:MAG: hypothetical protein ACJAS4_000102 [Bacteriovoracaceae bacterium]|jgi:hypothetical protein
MKLILFFTFIFIFTACLPEQQVRQDVGDSSSNSSDNSSDDSVIDPNQVFAAPQWLNSGLFSETLSIDVDNSKSVYLMGEQINNLLSSTENYKFNYCVEIRFPQTANSTPNRIWVKATPQITNSFGTASLSKYLVVNLGTDLGNSACTHDIANYTPSLTSALYPEGAGLKYYQKVVNGQAQLFHIFDSNLDGTDDKNFVIKTSDICPGCNNFINSNKVSLYINDSSKNYLTEVDQQIVDTSALQLRVDMNSNSDSGQSSCSDNDCQASGFDCCEQGQCITEKALKISGIQADPINFSIAESLKSNNPNWYKDYPQFYYSCLERPDDGEIEPTPAEPEDPISDAEDRLAALKIDYSCIEELKTNSLSDPFHNNAINGSATYTQCEINDPTSDTYYQTIMKRLYNNCGCSEKTDLDLMIKNCPAYTYEPIYKNDNAGNQTTEIAAFNCKAPPVAQTPLPFQDLEVIVNSRSAPHRFFDTANTEITPGDPLPSGATGIQEGEEFVYLDNYYIFPKNGSFNMNSILGQMTVQLDAARPAHQVKVDFDKQYIISTRSGFFQACPTCAKDSWFNNFSAYPFSNTGVGGQSTGYTTRRDTFVTNTTLGNYEDTIFNRACFVPPTMLPFSHIKGSVEQDQRLLRLKTQAAMYVNGYQRDWYGFNRGALIGSFDGVTWFAIGKGRIVKSSSDTLMLAINAPFADLTSPTNHIVAVQEYDFSATAPIYDYDPTVEINSAVQNEAGSCQEWHECETDSHCISKLGWEYTCADVSNYKTKWPSFETVGAKEIANTERVGTIVEFLQQAELPPGTSSKKCVYRGAGAPCRVDYANITDEGLRKNLTCAPNFYCANVNSVSAFNKEVARFGRPLDELVESKNHIYGQDANILGRPKHYINTGNLTSLPADVSANITVNLLETDSSGAGNFGLCRPGKRLPDYNTIITTKDWEQTEQHKAPDNNFRTDYTSQIAGCNSTLYTDLRYSSCPMLDEDGMYIHTQDDFLNDNFLIPSITNAQGKQVVTERYSFAQNSCGLESLSGSALPTVSTSGEDLKNYSAFKTIEGSPLSTSGIIFDQTMTRDACLRKAGSVCHTDLDCSPNRLMANVVDLAPLEFFGNKAEKTYYEEYLVCGQARKEPSVNDPEFNTYNIHNNRCCRPIGETITMFTEDSPNDLDSVGINSSRYGSLNPTASDRYTRYSVVESQINSTTKLSNIIRPSANTLDSDNNKVIDNSVNITNQNQWKTIHTAAAKTCCGGTWVRAFEDGTNDWSRPRLSMNQANFTCLNYRTPLQLSESASSYGMTQSQLDKDKADFCYDPGQTESGCSQHSFSGISDFSIQKPFLNNERAGDGINLLSSSLPTMESLWANNLFTLGRFVPYDGSLLNDRGYVLQWTDDSDPSEITRKNLITRIPTFVTFDNVSELNISLTDPQGGADIACIPATIITQPDGGLDAENADWEAGACPDVGGVRNCCHVFDPITRVVRVAFSNVDKLDPLNYDNQDSELKISFIAAGTLEWEEKKNPGDTLAVTDTSILDHRRSASPGNALYYLSRFSRLEYLGIPQMVYEPTYCNDNYQKLVPGIFKEDAFGQQLKTVMDFLNHDRTFYDSGVSTQWQSDNAPGTNNANSLNQNIVGTQELIDHAPIFSDNQIKCCLELGTSIGVNESSSMCCSGTAIEDETDDTKKICKLPDSTNLTVYFNKFVSGEGLSTGLDSPLVEDDFHSKTGEPKLNTNVLAKLKSLGESFCASGIVRRGSAFGNYRAQPVGPQGSLEKMLFSIVDNSADIDDEAEFETSHNAFGQGYKWNHHFYCAPGN